ncbi:MAG: TetR family transcriptional regulator [Parvibaculum sp.]|uniref:TetR/AcrR family transcriptional regulator n=1 Tax=Parvibaculum sp. TaxID=2024848 RepID=UPI003C71CB41
MMKSKEKTQSPRNDTRLRLILAAEKLFGEQGIHGVTLKEINAAAGQRNESALHYHFGSKPSLVEAILRHRALDIDVIRVERLDALSREGGEDDLRALLRATFMPLMELLATEEGVRFIRFIAQVLNDPDFDLPTVALRANLPGIIRANGLVVAALGDMPPEIAIQRQRFLVEMTVSSLAIWSRQHDAATEAPARELFIANLLDSIHGFLTAPVSPETLDALKKLTRKKEKK